MSRRVVLFGTVVLLGFALSVLLPSNAKALPFSFSNGDLAASVDFTLSTSTLTVVLTNTSSANVMNPSQVLTAVFFDSNGTLISGTAMLTAGSWVAAGPNGAGNVGGEWAYASGLSGAPRGAGQGISSSGFGLFGASTFAGPNLQGPAAVNGLNYGLTSAGDNLVIGNAAVTGSFPLIKNSVTFTLAAADGFSLNSITNVRFNTGLL